MLSLGSRNKADLFLCDSSCLAKHLVAQVCRTGVKLSYVLLRNPSVLDIGGKLHAAYKLFTSLTSPSDKHLSLTMQCPLVISLGLDEELGKTVISAHRGSVMCFNQYHVMLKLLCVLCTELLPLSALLGLLLEM